MSITLLVILCVAGLLLILADILLIPGGVVGFLGLGMMAFACYQAYECHGSVAGNIFVLFSVLAATGFVFYVLNPKSWKRVSQLTNVEGKVNTEDVKAVKVGDVGISLSFLRPSGTAQFGENLVEVSSSLGFIDANQAVEITEIESNKIIVKQINN